MMKIQEFMSLFLPCGSFFVYIFFCCIHIVLCHFRPLKMGVFRSLGAGGFDVTASGPDLGEDEYGRIF